MTPRIAIPMPAFGHFVPGVTDLRPKVARIRRRLHAWWEGYIDEALEAPAPAPEAANGEPAVEWSAPRIKIAEMVWGDGFAFPGGVERVIDMVKPMALNAKKSMLYLGAGLGGAPRAIAQTFGTWTTGLEASQVLAEAGMQYSKQAGLAKKALIRHFDPERVDLPAKKFDAVCVRHVLDGVNDRERLLGEIAKATRPCGHVLISDFAAGPSASAAKGRDAAVPPLDLDGLVRTMNSLNFDVRVAEDMTAEFRGQILEGWTALAGTLEGKSLDPEEATALAREVQVWSGRLAALASGALRVIRIHAIKNPSDTMLVVGG